MDRRWVNGNHASVVAINTNDNIVVDQQNIE
jgi:hypothetical protein